MEVKIINKNQEIPIIETVNLKKYFKVNSGFLHAVDDISIKIMKGETLGVVGESGCGKSTLGRTIIGLHKPTSGEVLFKGQNITNFSKAEKRDIPNKMSMIFQDPYSSLNSRMRVSDLIADPLRVNKAYNSNNEIEKRVYELMDTVGLSRSIAEVFPHELDGGRRQRIGVARALALNPEFVICDEPVSALDVSIQAQILNLLMDLQDAIGLSYMFITHNLSVVKHISTNIMVAYMGKCVEIGTREQITKRPMHPYTKALFSAILVPRLEERNKKIQLIEGEVSNPINPKPGCRFAKRCSSCSEKCMQNDIPLVEVETGHFVACTLYKNGVENEK